MYNGHQADCMEPNAKMTRPNITTPRQHWATVLSRKSLSEKFLSLELQAQGFAKAEPGQFVVVHCADESDYLAGQAWEESDDWPQAISAELRSPVALMRRPFSVADMPDPTNSSRLTLQLNVLGPGTRWLAEKAQVGAQLRLLGPLGNTFKIEGVRQAVLAGGGMGTAPMLFLARQLRQLGADVVLLAGAKTKEDLPLEITAGAQIDDHGEPSFCCDAFTELGVKVGITTDDGSVGRLGWLSDNLADYLSRHRELSQTGSVVYTCGPEVLMEKIAQIAQTHQLPSQVCLERYMACGMGACQSCVCKQKSESSELGWQYKLVCTDGPIFDGQSILW